ncbi:MAG: ROK family protein, partial [Calditrichota bacterium]
MDNVLGFEIGGTKLQVGLGPRNGLPEQILRTTVVPENGASGIRHQLEELVEKIVLSNGGWDEVNRIGIGFGGPVSASGVILKSFQIEGWNNFPLRKWAEELWKVPVAVQNDASTAALAEARHGAGR